MPTLPPHARIGAMRSGIDRAGRYLRDWMRSGLLLGPAEQEAMELLAAYRAEFAVPQTKVVMGLRSAVATEGAAVHVTQRLKRQPRIIGKLVRFPSMELTQMQDIGGCRAVLPDLETVERVRARIERWRTTQVARVDDYNDRPQSSGYRAVHVIVRRDATLIEIQLRTPWQQDWADSVERIDADLGLGLKDERGPGELLRYLERVAYAWDALHRTGRIDPETRRDVASARQQALAWLASRGYRP